MNRVAALLLAVATGILFRGIIGLLWALLVIDFKGQKDSSALYLGTAGFELVIGKDELEPR